MALNESDHEGHEGDIAGTEAEIAEQQRRHRPERRLHSRARSPMDFGAAARGEDRQQQQ
ncbi:hypothetical protein D3C87_2066820 [compost metagenome]